MIELISSGPSSWSKRFSHYKHYKQHISCTKPGRHPLCKTRKHLDSRSTSAISKTGEQDWVVVTGINLPTSHNMGQVHPRAAALEVSPSTGPDPTIFRSQKASSPRLPTSHPGSTQVWVTSTDESFSQMEYTPGGALPPPMRTLATKSKGIVRKLSSKARPKKQEAAGSCVGDLVGPSIHHTPKAASTLGEGIKAFEAMVTLAESRAGKVPSSTLSSRTVKASTFTRRRHSTSDNSHDCKDDALLRSSATSVDTARHDYHRRTSADSIKSSKSIKSRRAEREWRARVAGLALASKSPRATLVEHRGPVPPKRTPGPRRFPAVPRSDPDRSVSPGSDALLTPPHPFEGTLARSFISNKSFETLGHYTHPTPPPLESAIVTDTPFRDRKVSVPQSVSSFYFDPANPRSTTRPASFPANHLLSPVPQSASLQTEENEDEIEVGARMPTSPTPHKSSLPPFGSFTASPTSVNDTLTNHLSSGMVYNATLQYPTKRESHDAVINARRSLESVPSPDKPVRDTRFSSLPAQSRPNTDAKHSYSTPPRKGANGLTLDALALRSVPSSSTPAHTVQTPTSPYSPVTAYLLTAPIESLPWSRELLETADRPRAHPYALVPLTDSPAPPTPRSKSPFCTRREDRDRANDEAGLPFDDPSIWPKYEPRLAPLATIDSFNPPRPKQSRYKSNQSIPAALKPRKQLHMKVEVLGHNSLDVQRARRQKVDLTPGMETGERPPKSGLPMTDLQRWLQQTSISA